MPPYSDPSALNSLNNIPMDYPESDYMLRAEILDDALRKLGKGKPNMTVYPDYYDDLIMQIIDSVPLE